MPSLGERILPELLLIDAGPQRQRMLQQAVNGRRTRAAAFLSVVVATALFVLWDKLVASVPSSWALYPILALCVIGLGVSLWVTRRDIRRRLRVQLAEMGILVCIPCGYDLTGNITGRCPECGTPSAAESEAGNAADHD